jgi:hypothetical protein
VRESLWESEHLEDTTALAMCAECGRMFTTDANFDRHRMGGGDSYCVDPSTRGLLLNHRGFWSRPPREGHFYPPHGEQEAIIGE